MVNRFSKPPVGATPRGCPTVGLPPTVAGLALTPAWDHLNGEPLQRTACWGNPLWLPCRWLAPNLGTTKIEHLQLEPARTIPMVRLKAIRHINARVAAQRLHEMA